MMTRKTLFNLLAVSFLVLTLSGGILFAGRVQAQGPGPKDGDITRAAGDTALAALGTSFTYQGRLIKDNSPVTGQCDFQFQLYGAETGGSALGTETKTNVSVSDGYFSVPLDFGATAFAGEARWLAISVRYPAGSGSYVPLTGRVALTATPYAHSLRPEADVEGSGNYVLRVANSGVGDALRGYSNATDYNYAGLWGYNSSTGSGVYGINAGSGYGVYGEASTASGYGVYSNGKAHVEGDLTWKAHTGYLSIHSSMLQPRDNTVDWYYSGDGYVYSKGTSYVFVTPVLLPHGATVTEIKTWWTDAAGVDATLELRRLNPSSGYVSMATLHTSGNTGNMLVSSETTISQPNIDNSQYSYFLMVWLESSNIRHYQTVIKYTTTAPH